MELEELADVLLEEIVKRILKRDIKAFRQINKYSNMLCFQFLYDVLNNLSLGYLEKYGTFVKIIKDDSIDSIRYDYSIIDKYCKNVKIIKLEDDCIKRRY